MRMTLQPDLAELAPGDEVEFHIAMANDGSDPVEVELDLQGLDTDLWALSHPIPVIDAGAVGRATIRVRMPDDATPGERRISVSVRNAAGTVGASAGAALRVGSNDVVAIETDPASVSGRKGARLDTIVRNRGEETIRLRVSGRSDGASIDIRPAEFDLPAGKGARLKARITPTSRAWFREKRHGLVLDARGGTIPATTSAIYVQKPTVPPVFLRALAVLVALAVWAGATLVLFQRMSSTPEEVASGEITDVGEGDTTPPDVVLAGDVVDDEGAIEPPVVVAGSIDGPRDLAGTTVLVERISFGDEGTTEGSTGKVAALTPVALTSGTVLDKVETTTDEKGRFRVASGLVLGAFYRVTAARAGFDLLSQVVRTSEDTPEIELAMSLTPGRGAMTGRVVDADGTPIGGASVVATQGTVTYRTTTASSGDNVGTWTIDGLATPFTYLVTVASPGYASQQLTVEVDGGASLSGIDATVVRDRGTIRGRITYRDNGVGAVTVALSGEVARTTTTLTTGDLTGAFDFPNLPYGTYLLTFSAPGWLESSREVVVAAGDVPVDVKDLLPSTAVIQGVVAQQVEAGGCDYPDPTQAAAEVGIGSCGGVGVTVTGENGTWSTTTATGDGSFRLSGIPAGEYTVEFARYGYLPEFYRVVVGAGDVMTLPDDATYDVEMAAYVGPRNRVLEPLDTESVQMRLVPTTPLDAAEVTGIVRDAFDVETLFDAEYDDWELGCRDDRLSVTVIGQPDVVCLLETGGGFSLIGVAPGAAEVVINAPGFGTYTTTIQVSPEGETQMGLIALTPLASLVLNITGTGDVPVEGAVVFVSPTDVDVPLFKGAAVVRDCVVTRADDSEPWREQDAVPSDHESMTGICADADAAGDVSFARGLGTGAFTVVVPVNSSDPDPSNPAELAGVVPMDHRQLERAIDVRVGESARLDLRLRRYASIVGTIQIPNPSGSGYTNLADLGGLESFPNIDLTQFTEGIEFCEVDASDDCVPYEFEHVRPRVSFGSEAGLSAGQFRIDRIPPNEGQTLRNYRLTIMSDEGDFEKSPIAGDGIDGLAFGEVRTLNAVLSPEPTDVSFSIEWWDGSSYQPVSDAQVRVSGTAGFRTIDTPPYREELVLSCPSPDCDNGQSSEDGFAYVISPAEPIDGWPVDADGNEYADLGANGLMSVSGVFRTGSLDIVATAPGYSDRSVAVTLTAASGGARVVMTPAPRDVSGSVSMTPTPSAAIMAGLTATLTPVAGGAPLSASVSAAGAFLLGNVPPAQYAVTISGDGVFTSDPVTITVTPGTGATAIGTFDVTRQLELDVTVFECPPGSVCASSAYDATKDTLVAGATVQLFYKADSADAWPGAPLDVASTCTASASAGGGTGCVGAGVASFDGLASGYYRIIAAKSGYLTATELDLGEITSVANTSEFELTRYGSVSGIVRGVIASGDSVQTRLGGAEVTLSDGTTTYPASGAFTTDATGSFSIPYTAEVPQGTYTMTISAEGYASGTTTVAIVNRVNLPSVPSALVATPAAVSGSVTTTAPAPIANVLVSVFGADCSSVLADTTGATTTASCVWSGADGTYSGISMPPRTTTLVYREYSNASGSWRVTDRPTVERSVTPGLGESLTVDIEMRSAIGSITGSVRLQDYAGDSTTTAAVTVELLASGGSSVLSTITTSSNGTFTATDMSTGTYDVRISHPGYTSQTFQGLLVVANGTATVPTQTITAKTRDVQVVVSSNSTALTGLTMVLEPPVDFTPPAGQSGTITGSDPDSDGTYVFSGVAPGSWLLSSTNGASLTPVHIDVVDAAVTVPVDTSATGSNAASDVTGVSVSFVPLTGTIQGAAYSGGASSVLTGATITAGSVSATSSSGTWELRAPVGRTGLTLTVAAGGYTSSTATPASPVGASGESGINATLIAKPRDLVLNVTSNGTALTGLELTALHPDGSTTFTVDGTSIVDNGDGSYTIVDAVPGTWNFSTTNGASLSPKHIDASGISVTMPVDTAATGATATSDFATSAVRFVSISGTVTGRAYAGASSAALAGATVSYSADASISSTTNGSGTWDIRAAQGASGLSFNVVAGGYVSSTVSDSSPSVTLVAKPRSVTVSLTSNASTLDAGSALTVTATPPAGSGLNAVSTNAASAGVYTLANLAPTVWTITTAGGSTLSPAHLDIETGDGVTLTVPVDTAASGATAATTYAGGSIASFDSVAGTIVDSAGAAVSGADVTYGGTTVTSSDGTGAYALRAPTGEARSLQFSGTGGTASLSVTAPTSSADVTLSTVSLNLIVRSSTGSLLQGVEIAVSGTGTAPSNITSDANGAVDFVGIGAGSWTVSVVDNDGTADDVVVLGSDRYLLEGPASGSYAGLGPRTIELTSSSGIYSLYLQKLDKPVTATVRTSTDALVNGVVGAVITATSGSQSISTTSTTGGAVSVALSTDREWSVAVDYTNTSPDPDVVYATATRTIAAGSGGGALGVINISTGTRSVSGTLTGPSGRSVTVTASANGFAASSTTVDIDLDTSAYSLTGLSTDVTWRLDFSVTVGSPVVVTRWIGPGSSDVTMNQAVGADAIAAIRVVVVDGAEVAARSGAITVGLSLDESTTPGASTTTTLPLAESIDGGSTSTSLTLVAGQQTEAHTFANLVVASADTNGLLADRFSITVTSPDGYSVDVGASATLTDLDPENQTLVVRLAPDTRSVTATLLDSLGTTSTGDDTALGNRSVTLTRTIDGAVNTITGTADSSTTNLYTFTGVLPGAWSLNTPGFSSVPVLVPVETSNPGSTHGAGTLRLLSSTDRLDASQVSVADASVAVAGTSTITVQLADGNGNLSTSGGRVRLFTDLGSVSAVTDNANGTYTATYTAPSRTGTATITASLNGQMLADSATVEVVAGAPSASRTVITMTRASLPADGVATGTIVAQLVDASGNLVRTGGATVVFAESAANLSLTGSVTDHGDGTYSQTYTAGRTLGTAVISATVGGSAAGSVSVALTQITDQVIYSTLSAASSTLTAGGASTTISLQLKSDASTNVDESAGRVALYSTGGTLGAVSDNDDGTYSATFTPPTTAGEYVIWAALDGLALASTTTVTVVAAAASATTSSLTIDRFALPADGTSTGTVTVTLRDQYGNVLDGDAAAESVGVAVTGGGSLGAATATQQSDGTYDVTFTSASAVSTSVITATLDPSGTATTIGTTTVSNTPVTALGQHTTLSTSAASTTAGGADVTVTVQLKDGADAGDTTTSAGVFAIYASSGSISVSSNTLSSDGALSASFSPPTSVGPVTIWATIDGVAIADSATVTVNPASLSALVSSVSSSSTSLAADGSSTATITVTLRDQYGNAVTSAPSSGSVTVVAGSGSVGSLSFSGGVGTATFTAGAVAGVTRVEATVDGVALDDAAFITLTAGTASSPDAPTSLAATPGVRSVTLTWNVPSDDGGAAITDYVVEFSDDGTNFSTFADGTSTSTRATVTALTDGTEYTLRVSAVNSAGTGSASTTVTVTPGVPGEPTAFAATDGTDGTAVLSWSAPTTGGSGVTGYRVSYSTDLGATWSAEVDADSATGHVFTLADGSYEVRVRAVNAAGFGAYSSASVSVTGT